MHTYHMTYIICMHTVVHVTCTGVLREYGYYELVIDDFLLASSASPGFSRVGGRRGGALALVPLSFFASPPPTAPPVSGPTGHTLKPRLPPRLPPRLRPSRLSAHPFSFPLTAAPAKPQRGPTAPPAAQHRPPPNARGAAQRPAWKAASTAAPRRRRRRRLRRLLLLLAGRSTFPSFPPRPLPDPNPNPTPDPNPNPTPDPIPGTPRRWPSRSPLEFPPSSLGGARGPLVGPGGDRPSPEAAALAAATGGGEGGRPRPPRMRTLAQQPTRT